MALLSDILDRLGGEGHDETVFDWQDELAEQLKQEVAQSKVCQNMHLMIIIGVSQCNALLREATSDSPAEPPE